MKFKKNITMMVCLLSLNSMMAQQGATITNKDLGYFTGSWQGTLTYLDYSSNKPYSMQADINIRQIGTSNKFIFSSSYPKEPNANAVDTVTLAKDGRMIDGAMVKSKRRLTNGNLEIITEVLSADGNDNKPATIRHTYIVGKNDYINRKEVQFTGQTVWIKRNEYSYKKKSSK